MVSIDLTDVALFVCTEHTTPYSSMRISTLLSDESCSEGRCISLTKLCLAEGESALRLENGSCWSFPGISRGCVGSHWIPMGCFGLHWWFCTEGVTVGIGGFIVGNHAGEISVRLGFGAKSVFSGAAVATGAIGSFWEPFSCLFSCLTVAA